jgi:radical SAM superfamily enzyme YgiQ (UPF0313 family)
MFKGEFKDVRILFMDFNLNATPGINNGLAILSAVLKKNNHQIGLIFLCEELGYSFELSRIRQDILKAKPDVIGISLMETQLKYMVDFCNDLRTYYKGFMICGGPHPTMDPEGSLSIRGIDAVCVGEGDDALVELAAALEAGKDYKNISNLWFKLPNGLIIKNKLRPFKNLNELPAEDKELFNLDKILPIKNYQLETIRGRGCVYGCSYCINHSYLEKYLQLCEKAVTTKEYVRAKKMDTVLTEIKDTVRKHPQIQKIAFIDDDFLMYPDLENFCTKYREEIDLPFICNVNPLSFNFSKGKLLREGGCEVIRLGVESGSERIKKEVMKRPISNKSISRTSNGAIELGLGTSFYNMIGLPTETKEDILKTLRLNAALRPDFVKLMTFYPFKNTPLYNLCIKLNLIDINKRDSLDNYDTYTCLRFSPMHQLFLKKIQTAFNWYINLFLDNAASPRYKALIKTIESMTEDELEKFDFLAVDEEVSRNVRKKGVLHYSKFLNRSLAVKFPSEHEKLD